MAVTIFAAIDVGSHQTAMRIYEISKKYGVHEIEHVHHTVRLGYETYSTAHLSHHSVTKLCSILNGFREKMKEYDIKHYMVIATSALREADNNLTVLDQIKQNTNFSIRILNNSEQRYLCYKAIALTKNSFHRLIQKGTVLVDVGGGSIQISLFDHSSLIATQNIALGSLRIQEILQNMKNETDNYQTLIYEYIHNDIHNFTKLYLTEHRVKNIIAVGNQLNSFISYLTMHDLGNVQPFNGKGNKKDSITRREYETFYQQISTQPAEELSKELNTSTEQAALLLPTAMIYKTVFQETGAEQMWLSGITICDGMAADFAERKMHFSPAHRFSEDIISASWNIAKRYGSSDKHLKYLESIALKIFDTVRSGHHLTKKDRMLLRIATILHNCGNYINQSNAGENSFKIVMATEIIGISHKERMMTAYILRYMEEAFPSYQELQKHFLQDEYIKMTKLNAILRLANALDRSHEQKFNMVTVELDDTVLSINGATLYDITLERGFFNKNAECFEEAFGIKPILHHKKRKDL